MHMKTGVEQSIYAVILLNMLPDKAVLSGEAISQKLGASPTYFQKLLRELVRADLITSMPGVKGGFKLKKRPEDICVYDIYLAMEGQQPLYTSSGILEDMLYLGVEERCCLLDELMEKAESAWKSELKRETIASLTNQLNANRFKAKVEPVQEWLKEKRVL